MRITKHLFLKTLFCPSYGWLSYHQKTRKERNEADQFRIEQGLEIGKLARGLFPDGILIEESSMEAAAEKTRALMESTENNCLFEAAFLSDGFATKADILVREKGSWNLIEVKSSVKDKVGYIADLAYTSMVIEMCGYEVEQRQLCLLSRDFHTGLDIQKRFLFLDHSRQVKIRTEEYRKLAPTIPALLGMTVKPEEPFKLICKNCDYFGTCFDFDILEHIISLPFISRKLYDKLMAQGISKIVDLPEALNLTPHQTLMKKSLTEQKIVTSEELPILLDKVKWPAFYLDFETTMTAIPLFPETYPYQQIVTQYSLHICLSPGEIKEHREYLAETDRDYRKDLAENLIRDLEGEGSIIVYSGFEKSTIKKLASLYPDLSKELLRLIPRLVDLEIIIKNGIYHPAFLGRSSIKKTLPALVPEMDYEDLAIGNGSAALTAFAKMVRGDIPAEDIPQLRRDLLVYCKQDTLAMVKLHEALILTIKKQENEKEDIMAYKIITHDRKAHIDEVLASALLSIHLGEEPGEIIRMPSQEAAAKVQKGELDPNVWFLDCGMVHDPERKLFDHHHDNQLGCAALLVFEEFFPHLQDSELADYIRLVSKVDTGGLRVLDDYEEVHETQAYWSFSQKLLMRSFEENPRLIVALFREGLEDKIKFEQAKKKASLWLETEHHTEIRQIGEINVLLYHVQPPLELASAIRAVDGKIVDEHEIDAIYSFDDKEPENRVFFRTNWGHDRLDFTKSSPAHPAFCHQGGFLMKFIPENDKEWVSIIEASTLL